MQETHINLNTLLVETDKKVREAYLQLIEVCKENSEDLKRVEQKLAASESRLQTLISEVERKIEISVKNGLATTTYVEAPNRNQVNLSDGWQIPLP